MNDWKETQLWKQLASTGGGDAIAVRALLDRHMPGIQEILAKAHTAPSDFTLHDSDHSFRVAEWMAKIIPADVLPQLAPYELALLLLSAYLHDIGMTPEQGQVDRHWHYLVYGPPGSGNPRQPLTKAEIAKLQGWLDDEGQGLTIPLAPDGRASEETTRQADLLIAHYCRHKHNDWSEDWIRTHLIGEKLPAWETWANDLIQLCRSHHEGYDDLRKDRFNPRPSGREGKPVHHRYLACVLRIADILDIDPERTPDVVFRHRTIHPESVLYWRKDHETWISQDGATLVLATYPESAVIENAIRKTANGILDELRTCARLNREHPFHHWALRASEPLAHRWRFPETLNLHVQPRDNAYVYIEGAFRPNTEKLLELLSGTQLYGDILVAVRELLQNAFDAVKEAIAYKRLERPDDPDLAKSLTQLHRVELSLEEQDDHYWIICRDDGVGMTQRIIEEYLLVSGNRQRREIVELARRCEEAGFRLGRTGQFGIGVLSYFMLADRVEIRTRRNTMLPDSEGTGWFFATDGVGSFGELRKDSTAKPGTEVRLRLKATLETPIEFAESLTDFLTEILNRIPCNLQFKRPGQGSRSWSPGWALTLEQLAKMLIDSARLPEYKRKRRAMQRTKEVEARRQQWAKWKELALASLYWRIEEGEIPERLGTYRVSVPFFELPGGRCAAFLFLNPANETRLIYPLRDEIYKTMGINLPSNALTSINGMAINISNTYGSDFGSVLEVDWESKDAGEVRVDRTEMELSPAANSAIDWLAQRATNLMIEILSEKPSDYGELNSAITRRDIDPGARQWLIADTETVNSGAAGVWRTIPLPALHLEDISFLLGNSMPTVFFQGRPTALLESVTLSDPRPNPAWTRQRPNKIVLNKELTRAFRIARLWTNEPPVHGPDRLKVQIADFPPNWNMLTGVQLENESIIWNSTHPLLVGQVEEEAELWFQTQGLSLSAAEEALVSSKRAAYLLAAILTERATDFWSTLLENNPGVARRLLETALLTHRTEAASDPLRILFWHETYFEARLLVLEPSSFQDITRDDQRINELLPDPGKDWTIVVKRGRE